jgi:hypothetical protein
LQTEIPVKTGAQATGIRREASVISGLDPVFIGLSL